MVEYLYQNWLNVEQYVKLGKKMEKNKMLQVYGARLAAMRPLIVAAAKKSLGNDIQVNKNLS